MPLVRALIRRVDQGVCVFAYTANGGDAAEAGVESPVLATLWRRDFRVHLSGGGFHDGRPEPTEKEWKAGGIVDVSWGRLRSGLDLRNAGEARPFCCS